MKSSLYFSLNAVLNRKTKIAFECIADRREVKEQKEIGIAAVQTDKPEGVSVSTQYTDYTEQQQEAIRRLVKIVENNNLHFKQKKLRGAVELALREERTEKEEILKQKRAYLETRRVLDEEHTIRYTLSTAMSFAVSVANFFEQSQTTSICYTFDRILLNKTVYQKGLKTLRNVMKADLFRQSENFNDIIRIVKDATIPMKYSKLAQGCIALYDFVRTRKNHEKAQAAATLKSYCLSMINNPQDLRNASPKGNQTKRGLFSSSRVTGSFVMSLAENFNEGSDKILGLFEKVLSDTFK